MRGYVEFCEAEGLDPTSEASVEEFRQGVIEDLEERTNKIAKGN